MNRSVLLTSIQRLQLRKDSLLQELESLNLDLKSQRAQLSQLVNEDAPVYRLPNELLTSIFLICAKTSTSVWPSEITRIHMSPGWLPFQVAASHVSHRWRHIVLGTPLLWNAVNMNRRMVSQLEAHLDRSGSCFLDISLNFQDSDDLAIYCQLLAKHSRRWRRLSILTTFEEISEIREMLREVQVPILEHLSLILGRPQLDSLSPRLPFTSVIPSILASCPPCLSFVRLAGQALGNIHPPTSSVTTLHLDGWSRRYMTHDQFKVILVGAPLLINLSLNQLYLHHPRDPLAITKPTTLPSLRALRICGPCSPVSRFLSLLDMPQLEAITLERVETFDSPVMRTVRSLTLDYCVFSEQEITKLIDSFPSLSDINIDGSLPDFFFLLLPGPEGDTKQLPWPELQTIAIRNLQSVDVPYFNNMVSTRQAGDSNSLRKILLDRRSRIVLRTRLEKLQERVIVENAELPPWPIGLQYEDAHDQLE